MSTPKSVPPASATPTRRIIDDLWGGLAATLVALPSAIAFGVAIYTPLGQVAHGAVAGIYGALALGLVAPLLGGAPRLISAPCAPAAAVLTALASELALARAPGAPSEATAGVLLSLVLVGAMAGGLQLLYGALRGGRLIKYIPYPVVSGYLSAVGVIILLGQLPKLLGLDAATSLWRGLAHPTLWRWQGVLVGAVTMVLVLVSRRIIRAVPGPIVGLAGGLLAYLALGRLYPELMKLDGNPLLVGPVVGSGSSLLAEIASLWGAIEQIELGQLAPLLGPALTLSVLLSIDTLKTCVVVDALTRSRHDSNRELRGQGLGNLAAALLGGLPGAGTMGATLVNVSSGGRTRLSGVFEGGFVLMAYLFLGRAIGWVPIAALAGILIVVAFRMMDLHSFHLLARRTTAVDFVVIASVVAVAVRLSLIAAAGVGLGLAILLFIREQIRGSVVRRKVQGHQISSKRHRLPAEKEALQRAGDATIVCEVQGSLFFGTTDQLFTELEGDLKRCQYLMLDLRRVQSVDFTAAHMLEQFAAMMAERGGHLVFSNVPAQLPTGQDLARYFKEVGLVRSTQNVKVFATLDEALEWTEDQVLAQTGLLRGEDERPLELRELELFREFEEDETLEAVAGCLEERSCRAGELIFRQGDAGDEFFLVRSGLVRIALPCQDGRRVVLATFGPGHFFGDMAFLDRGTRSAEATAQTRVELYVISRRRFDEVSRAHPIVGVKMFARLARTLAVRLRYTDAELRALQEY